MQMVLHQKQALNIYSVCVLNVCTRELRIQDAVLWLYCNTTTCNCQHHDETRMALVCESCLGNRSKKNLQS